MSLNTYSGIGRVSKVTHREIEDKDGILHVTHINVPINIWQPGRGGADPTEETLWFELSAFGRATDSYNQAIDWSTKFEEGDRVYINGEPIPRVFQKGDGTPGFALKLNKPKIGHVAPKNRDEAVPTKSDMPF